MVDILTTFNCLDPWSAARDSDTVRWKCSTCGSEGTIAQLGSMCTFSAHLEYYRSQILDTEHQAQVQARSNQQLVYAQTQAAAVALNVLGHAERAGQEGFETAEQAVQCIKANLTMAQTLLRE